MDKQELGVSDLAEKLSIGKSTTHRLLKTLSSEGVVIKDPKTKLYSLGVAVLSLTNTMRSQLNILN
jgi:DNA-binding IclR family transcriptional regulator